MSKASHPQESKNVAADVILSEAKDLYMNKTPQESKNIEYTATWYDADEMRWAVRDWATRIGVKPIQVQIRPMNTKWASISTSGRLTLNSELLSLPKELGEFVIVHELVHLLVPNHGKVFKSFMLAYMPDWEERERELRGYVKEQKKEKIDNLSY